MRFHHPTEHGEDTAELGLLPPQHGQRTNRHGRRLLASRFERQRCTPRTMKLSTGGWLG